jgi:hypothetical protein
MNLRPFDARSTLMIDPRFSKDYSIFHNKSDETVGPKTYEIRARPQWGTLGIHTNTRAAYRAAYDYICSIYGLPHDEDDECVLWEMEPATDDAWVDGEIYQTEAATWNDE